jgi:hypothetical protein
VATHVRVIAVLFMLGGALGVLGAVASTLLLGVLAGIIGASPDGSAAGAAVLGFTGIALSALLFLLAVPSLLAGYGLWRLRPRGRTLGIIMAANSLMKIPHGTRIGIYVLVILFRQDTVPLFQR